MKKIASKPLEKRHIATIAGKPRVEGPIDATLTFRCPGVRERERSPVVTALLRPPSPDARSRDATPSTVAGLSDGHLRISEPRIHPPTEIRGDAATRRGPQSWRARDRPTKFRKTSPDAPRCGGLIQNGWAAYDSRVTSSPSASSSSRPSSSARISRSRVFGDETSAATW